MLLRVKHASKGMGTVVHYDCSAGGGRAKVVVAYDNGQIYAQWNGEVTAVGWRSEVDMMGDTK